jgi:hypothetical protein
MHLVVTAFHRLCRNFRSTNNLMLKKRLYFQEENSVMKTTISRKNILLVSDTGIS